MQKGGPVRFGGLPGAIYAGPLCFAALVGLIYLKSGTQNGPQHLGSVHIVGSETMRPVVTACAAEFMIRNPQADVIVKGGGSGDGVAAMLHGMADIGMVSRELSLAERDDAVARGIEISMSELARDGIAIISHPSNAVFAVDLGQLRDVFSGKIRSWRELGSKKDLEAVAFARAEGSGTASLFGERVLRGEGYAQSVRRMPTNEAVVAEVAAQPGAIGYADLGTVRAAGSRVKAFAVRVDPQSAPVAPTAEAVQSAHYPLTRTLYFGVAGKPSGTAKGFLDFCSGASGRTLIERAGYIGIAHSGQ